MLWSLSCLITESKDMAGPLQALLPHPPPGLLERLRSLVRGTRQREMLLTNFNCLSVRVRNHFNKPCPARSLNCRSWLTCRHFCVGVWRRSQSSATALWCCLSGTEHVCKWHSAPMGLAICWARGAYWSGVLRMLRERPFARVQLAVANCVENTVWADGRCS